MPGERGGIWKNPPGMARRYRLRAPFSSQHAVVAHPR